MHARARPTSRLSLVLFSAALWLTVLPAAASPAAAPRVVGVSKVPLVAAAGDRISLTARVAGTGKSAAIGLVIGAPNGSPKGGLALGKGVTVKHRGTKNVVVRGLVPKAVPPGFLGTLLVCVNPAAAIKAGSACRKAAKIATSGTSTEERIAGARLAGRLPKAKAILLGLQAIRGGTQVPSELRGALGGPSGEGDALKAAAQAYPTLPAAVKKQVLPFFIPPAGRGSAWSGSGAKPRSRAAGAAALNCGAHATLETGEGNPWRGIPAADGKSVVWYPEGSASDQAAARRYASEMPKIWKKLTTAFRTPLPDGAEPCYHGPDGRYDIYVGDRLVHVQGGGGFFGSPLAVTVTYPNGGASCTQRPSWIAMRPGLSYWALAHEFMHAIQFSHKYLSCNEPISWWDEGGATWAGDFVYPEDNTEQRRFPSLVTNPIAAPDLSKTSYEAWPFWMMLERNGGVGVLRSIFASLRSKPPVDAVDTAISGGFKKQLPKFFVHAYNQTPVGDAAFAVPKSFGAWDKWNATPSLPAQLPLNLNALTGSTLLLPMQTGQFVPLSLGAYNRVTVPDNRIKALKFTNDLVGKPGAHVDALLHLADGTWKLADWTAEKEVDLCRDKAEENVRDLVIISTNAGKTPLERFNHLLRARTNCPFPQRFTATWTRVQTWPERGSWTATFTGSAEFVRNELYTEDVTSNTGSVYYDLKRAEVRWSVSGSSPTVCPHRSRLGCTRTAGRASKRWCPSATTPTDPAAVASRS